jgi:hypothetical protein
MLRKDYHCNCSVEEKLLVVRLKGLAAQDELIGGKPPVVK